MLASVLIVAHQGGWDEMLLVATPIALFVLLLRAANNRALKHPPTTPPDDADRSRPDDPDDAQRR